MTTSAVMEALASALERVTYNFRLMMAGKPVRDVAETLAEADSAIRAFSHPSPGLGVQAGSGEVREALLDVLCGCDALSKHQASMLADEIQRKLASVAEPGRAEGAVGGGLGELRDMLQEFVGKINAASRPSEAAPVAQQQPAGVTGGEVVAEALRLLSIVTNVHHVGETERYTAEKELIRTLHRMAPPQQHQAGPAEAGPVAQPRYSVAGYVDGHYGTTIHDKPLNHRFRAVYFREPAPLHQPQDAAPGHGEKLWLWKNGDHFLAFRHLYPCFTPGGDPMTLGEPVGYAVFKESHDRSESRPSNPPVAAPHFMSEAAVQQRATQREHRRIDGMVGALKRIQEENKGKS
jgi:hypothetical protein